MPFLKRLRLRLIAIILVVLLKCFPNLCDFDRWLYMSGWEENDKDFCIFVHNDIRK